MLLARFFLLLLILIYASINNSHQNERSFLTKNSNQRIKRFFHRKSSKSQWNTEQLLKNNQPNTKLNNNSLFSRNPNEKQSKSETNKGYTQQDIAEIKRILFKNENDYYGILNINKDATRDKIINAHRKLTLLVHPDKINAPGATEATQRLNKARTALLKKFENQNNDHRQQTTKSFTIESFTLNNNKKNNEVSDIEKKSILSSTFSLSVLSETKKDAIKINSLHNKFNYLILTFIVLTLGIPTFIIYWKKRQRHSYPLNIENISKKQKLPPTYDSPESDDGDAITTNENREISMITDEERTNLVNHVFFPK
ncbi:unnamed protein product [Rotaria sp. Silwood2]|nr:unnamed protein product [Rotaria sp. Silwood2]CAF4411957.1 unnamed protein product [Rotaria sp. Silwood2]